MQLAVKGWFSIMQRHTMTSRTLEHISRWVITCYGAAGRPSDWTDWAGGQASSVSVEFPFKLKPQHAQQSSPVDFASGAASIISIRSDYRENSRQVYRHCRECTPWLYRSSNCQTPSLKLLNPKIPIVSIVVPFWGYLIGPLIYNWLNQKKGTTMETIGKPRTPTKTLNSKLHVFRSWLKNLKPGFRVVRVPSRDL